MTNIYQATGVVNGDYYSLDFDTAEQAAKHVEDTKCDGTVVRFIGRANAPFCLPETVYNSSSMWTFEAGVGRWYERSMHDGYNGKVSEERPH
jgi:hypothetical protein